MNFLAPAWLAAAAVGAFAVVALHFITTQRPPASALPTARFVPAGDVRALSRAARPADLIVLLMRCAALLFLGAAFARPVTHGRRRPLARVIAVDRSRATRADVRDSALAIARPGDALVLFDSAAVSVTDAATDSLRTLAAGTSRGSLSAALVGALRAGGDLSRTADSVELVIVSPLTADEIDAATTSILARWPGRVRLVRTAAAPPVVPAVNLVTDDRDDDLAALVAAMAAAAPRGAPAQAVRIVRRVASAADSAAARGGTAVVVWPGIGTARSSAQGLWAGAATVVAPLARLAIPAGGHVVARWADGARAAAAWTLGRGCVRAVGVGVPLSGDVALQPAFMAVARTLLAPCNGVNAGAALTDSLAKVFDRAGAAAPAAALRAADESSPFAFWLFVAALVLLAAELFVRRKTAEPAA